MNRTAIQILKENPSRKDRRGFEKEAKKLDPYLADIETKFEYALFNAPDHLTYDDLYKYFNKKWTDLVRDLMLKWKLKYSAIDIHHFARQYKPRHNQYVK